MIRRFSVTTGVLIGAMGTFVGISLLVLGMYFLDPLLRFFLLAASFALLAYFPHCIAHLIVGKIVGLEFSHYVLGSSPLQRLDSRMIRLLDSAVPRLGIRLHADSRRNASYKQRLMMFSSGVVTSTLLPIIPTIVAYTTILWPLGAILPLLWIFYLIFGVFFSPRYGDLSRIKVRH